MITGTQSPMVGKEEFYGFSDPLDIFNISNATFVWNIWKKNKLGSWINITHKPEKMGQKVSFKFGEKVIGVEFKLQVYKSTKKLLSNEFEAKLAGEIFVIPRSAKTAKIDKVILFNQGAKDPNRASYKDSLIARAYCVAMFNQEVEFRLWEDDAVGGGHNSTINKNNQLPQVFKARVNEKGIAEVKISLLSNGKVLRAIADKYLMNGDKSEGASHEFYVTASYNGKIEGASQVNVDVTSPSKQPKRDSAIFPGTSNQPEKSDKEKKVTHAYFINSSGNPTNHIKVGDTVRIRIKTNNMIGEYFQYIVWEKDRIKSDDIFRSTKMKIISNSIDTSPIIITRKKFDEGIDANFPGSGDSDKDQQQYFIEIIPLSYNTKSVNFGIDDEAKRTKVDSGISPVVVNGKKPAETNTTCICKEKYKDLIWGGKVSCDFRKKVVEICTELWPAKPMEMANGLMAVMNVETSGSFKAQQVEGWRSVKDPKEMSIKDFWKNQKRTSSSAVGLIQFTQDALQNNLKEYKSNPKLSTEEKFNELNKLKLSYAQMGEINQLEKVKKYFSNITGIEKPEDIYLAVFAPKGLGKEDDYILYEGGTDEYKANASVDKKSKGIYKNDGDIQRSEILERFHHSKKEGENNKATLFTCGKNQKKKNETDNNKWHDPVDNPICTIFTQNQINGIFNDAGKHWGLFGKTRGSSTHYGLDLFAKPGSPIYACVECKVEKIITDENIPKGYGKQVFLKVIDKKTFMEHYKKYSKIYPNLEFENIGDFSTDNDIILHYAHLRKIYVKQGWIIKNVDVPIGETGVSGVIQGGKPNGTCAPHLHFEIRNTNKARINPGFFINYKNYDTMGEISKNLQQSTAIAGKIFEFNGIIDIYKNETDYE